MSPRPLVYISYSHKDQGFVDELLKFLRPFERTAAFHVWYDKQIQPGAKWEEAIDAALKTGRDRCTIDFVRLPGVRVAYSERVAPTTL